MNFDRNICFWINWVKGCIILCEGSVNLLKYKRMFLVIEVFGVIFIILMGKKGNEKENYLWKLG